VRPSRIGLAIALLAAAAAPAAWAGHIDRVVVGEPGRNDTAGFSPALSVEVMVENDYKKVDFDGDHGNWLGPPYHSTTNSMLGGQAKVSWTVYFDRGLTVKQAIDKHLIHKWAKFQAARIEVPYVVKSVRVAKIAGQWLLTKGPEASTAQFEGVLAFPLCHGVVAAVEFDFLEPFTDDAGSGAQYRVYTQLGDKGATTWNQEHATLAPTYVALDGYLPAAQVTAHAAGRVISGAVRDCSGASMPSVPIKAGSTSGHAGPTGTYTLRAANSGTYRVTATAGGATATSPPVTVR
jgi:hypothetical protein